VVVPDNRREDSAIVTATDKLRAAAGALAILGCVCCSKQGSAVSADSISAISGTVSVSSVLSSTPSIDSAVARRIDSTSENSLNPAAPSPPISDANLDVLRSELVIPVSGVLASELRDTFTEARGEGRIHDAIDIPAPRGTHVLSATPGRVLKLFTSKAGGLMVYAADSSDRFILMYGHLDGYAPGLVDGAALTRGQVIGFVGTTGNAPPNLPHLHFAISRSANISRWWQGTPVNPYPLLRNK
jgi:murein DD-endopeptidase MepM/ murein hydrolase activator NlpD